MSGPGGRITAVADSTGACLAQLRPAAFTNRSEGRVGVAARPGMRRVSWLVTDILSALGCDPLITGAGRPGDGDPHVAAAWLRTHGVRDLYVQFAWDISYPALHDTVMLARRAGVHLWLVGDTPYSDRHAELLEPFAAREWTGDNFLDHWSHLLDAPAGDTAPTQPDPDAVSQTAVRWPPRLPDDDFTTFRAACRDRLAGEEFAAVDAFLRDAHQDAIDHLVPLLSTTSEAGTPGAAGGLEHTVAKWFGQRWATTDSLAHFIVTVRASQVAAFGAGYFVQVDLDQLIGTASTTPRRAQRNPDTWRLLQAYPQPYRAAACALAAAGMGTNEMAELPVATYDPATGTAHDDSGRPFTVELPARLFVETQQTLRRLTGAGETDRLFVGPGDGRPMSARTLASAVRQARRELGAAVALAAPDRATPEPSRWCRRWGISIQELT